MSEQLASAESGEARLVCERRLRRKGADEERCHQRYELLLRHASTKLHGDDVRFRPQSSSSAGRSSAGSKGRARRLRVAQVVRREHVAAWDAAVRCEARNQASLKSPIQTPRTRPGLRREWRRLLSPSSCRWLVTSLGSSVLQGCWREGRLRCLRRARMV